MRRETEEGQKKGKERRGEEEEGKKPERERDKRYKGTDPIKGGPPLPRSSAVQLVEDDIPCR